MLEPTVTDHLVENGSPDCIYLSEKKCTVYEARPTQCRTWPFWPENMNAKRWNDNIQSFCPGVGKGKLHSAEFIGKQIEKQKKADFGVENWIQGLSSSALLSTLMLILWLTAYD